LAKFNAMRDFGGWGIRGNSTTKAFIAKGNVGVKLDLKDEKSIILGMENPETADRFINRVTDMH